MKSHTGFLSVDRLYFSIDMVSLTGNIFGRPVIVYRSAIPDGIWSILTDMFSTNMPSLTGFLPNDATLPGRAFIAIGIDAENIR
jgi:hypothetical protein